MSDIRVRYAPSPTGPQHIGGIRTALYNYLFAKKMGGKFILRIEDTDSKRFVEGAEDYLIKSMEWCGLSFDEGPHVGGEYGPYRQSERNTLYKQYADQLIKEGKAYYAFDTTEELDEKRKIAEQAKVTFKYDAFTREDMLNSLTLSKTEVDKRLQSGAPYTIRIKVPVEESILVNDLIRGEIIFNSSELDDKVLFKSEDMLPTYHLANVVDDYLMKITHVIRGEEWLPSSPLHVLLYQYLGWENLIPKMAHLPLLLKPNGKGKLSKRDGDALGFPVFPLEWTDPKTGEVSSGYKESGYFSEAFLNIIAFLGWNPGTEKELYTLSELINDFSLDRVNKSGAKFDPDKARWFNQQFLWKQSDAQLAQLLIPYLTHQQLPFKTEQLSLICGQMKERISFVGDIAQQGTYFFTAPKVYDQQTVQKKWKEDSADLVTQFCAELVKIDDFTSATIENVFKNFVTAKNVGMGQVMIALRLCLTGQGGGPNLFFITEMIGKTETINRIDSACKTISDLKTV